MDTSRISFGEMVAAASGVALFIFMFFPWYGVDVEGLPGVGDTPDFSAWEAFDLIDILLFLAAAIAVAIAVLRALGSMPDLPAPPGRIVLIAGAVATVLVLFRLLVTPGEDTELLGVDIEITRKIGIFLGLIAAGGIAYGGYRQLNDPASAGSLGSGGGTTASTATAPPPPPPAAPPTPPPAAPPTTPTDPGPPPAV